MKKRKRLLTLIFNLVPPEMVKLVPSKTTVCQGEIITFNCSANSNPAVHTYRLYVNGSMVNEVIRRGVWNITMTTGGVFVYKCMVNNTIGTALSEDVTITVNGKHFVFTLSHIFKFFHQIHAQRLFQAFKVPSFKGKRKQNKQ